MPIARFKGVLICSSEDKNYPATNLINGSNKKWKCEEPGIDSVYVVLQFECPTKINGIDIGNENSTFIEVSVGRNGWPVEKFKTILVSSSFMSLPESRVSENPNRVRCFGKDSLMPEVLDEKWDLIKVTCTQVHKHAQFGLSFIKVSTPDAISTSTAAAASASPLATVVKSPKDKKSCDDALELPKNSVFAQFKIRSDSSDSDKESEQSTSLFSKWKQEKNSPQKASTNGQSSTSSAAAIRDASSSMAKLQECTKINRKIETPSSSSSKARKSNEGNSAEAKKERMNRYRRSILYDDDDDDENTSNPKLEKAIEQDKEQAEEERKQWLDKKKAKTPNSKSREEKSNQKMESSSDKYKLFLSDDIADKSSVQSEPTNPNSSRNVTMVDDDEIMEVKTESPAKTSSRDGSNSQGTSSQSPVSVTPSRQVWKTKRPSPFSSDEENPNKRSRTSSSSDEDLSSARVQIDQILRGVVFVISGIQNPERAQMRNKAMKMGAKYKPDWNDSCTHLICAFKNTPKYNQVRGQGIIVNKDWIDDCLAAKKKLPWQDYQL